MENINTKTELLIGKENVEILKSKKVIVFGLGGVGSYVVEALARSSIENLTLVDKDIVVESNINRQLYALNSTLKKSKAEIAKNRVLDINPNCEVRGYVELVDESNVNTFFDQDYDYIVDAIDDTKAKLELIKYANRNDIAIISSMGTANKLDTTKLQITDINKTSVCPLAKTMRKKVRDEGIKKLDVIYSTEMPLVRNPQPCAMVFVPACAGIMIANYIVRKMLNI